MEPFFAFESVSRWNFTKGLFPPGSGHLIIFFRVKVEQDCDQIQLVLEEREVDAAVWLSVDQLEMLFEHKDMPLNGLFPGKEGSQNKKTELRMSQLFPNFPNASKEGVSKAHNFAMKHLLKHYFN
mmetsp:Transcript_38276/g.36627  ORF Transcript_38276/g.36627 Transcript_38276/m.36627 type:complete len:125 (+) Transcript_38276:589-963(+)